MNTPIILVPTRAQVENLKVGDLALNCWGKYSRVVNIYARGNNIKGKAYVLFYTENGEGSSISGDYVEDDLIRTLPLTGLLNSAQCDALETQIVRERKAQVAS